MVVFVAVAGALATEFFFQIVTGDHLCFGRALGKNHADILSALRSSLQGKDGTGSFASIRFVEIDCAFLHDFPDFFLTDMTAIHAAKRMSCVNQGYGMPVKSFPLLRFIPAPDEKCNKEKKEHDNGHKGIPLFHGNKCNRHRRMNTGLLTIFKQPALASVPSV